MDLVQGSNHQPWLDTHKYPRVGKTVIFSCFVKVQICEGH